MSQFLFTFLFLFPLTLLRPPISPPRDCWLSWELRSSEALLLRRAAWASGKLCKIKKCNVNPKYSKHAGIGCKWIIIVYCTCTNSSKYFSVVPCTKVSVFVSRGEGGLLFWSREILDWISVGNWNTLKFNLWNSATFDFWFELHDFHFVSQRRRKQGLPLLFLEEVGPMDVLSLHGPQLLVTLI